MMAQLTNLIEYSKLHSSSEKDDSKAALCELASMSSFGNFEIAAFTGRMDMCATMVAGHN